MAPLEATLVEIQNRISRYKTRQLNEQNTKATLIEPVLRELGWDVEDLEVVQREYKVKRRDKPVDYALFNEREPALFVEAKALGLDLTDRKWASQIMGYASVAGVPWIVLTNGDEYRIYNAHATVPVEKKLFRTVSIKRDAVEAATVLALLDKSKLVESDLEHLWQAHYADQEVKAILADLFGSGVPDPSLVNLVKKKGRGLSAKDVRASLARVRVEMNFPPEVSGPKSVPSPPARKGSTRRAGRKPPEQFAVTLSDLIAAGLIVPPLALSRKYKGQEFSAQVEADGRVRFRGKLYDAPSAAAGEARKSVIGAPAGQKLPPTNGWSFWRFRDASGKTRELKDLREDYSRRTKLRVVG